jgi:YD repeat-containing protein
VKQTVRLMNVRVDLVADPANPGQMQSVIGLAGTPYSTNAMEFLENGWVKSRTGPDGKTTSYEYWADGQTMAVTDALTNRTSYVYDAAGRQASMTNALNYGTQFVYDAMDRQVAMIFADGSGTTIGFNDIGQRTSQTDQAGLHTQFGYTVSGLLKNVVKPQVLDPENGNTNTAPQWNYNYDEQGHLLIITDAKGHSTTNTFNEFGQQFAQSLSIGTASNQFNSKGQLWKQYDFKGQWTEFVYDQFGRKKAKFLFGVGAAYPSNSVCYQYNQLGQMFRITERYDEDASTNTCDGYMALIGLPKGGISRLLKNPEKV